MTLSPPADTHAPTPPRTSKWPPLKHWLWMLVAFCVLSTVFMFSAEILNHVYRVYTKPSASRLVGQPLPDFTMPVLGDATRTVSKESLLGAPYLLSTWSSWCYGCREEHAAVASFAASKRVKVIGFNIQDETADAQAWLQRYGDPYAFNLIDGTGRTANRMEIYTSPHHVLVDAKGVVRWKRSAIMDEKMIRNELLPTLATLERESRR